MEQLTLQEVEGVIEANALFSFLLKDVFPPK